MKKVFLCCLLMGTLALTACGTENQNNQPEGTPAGSVAATGGEISSEPDATLPETEATAPETEATTEAPKSSAPVTFDPDLALLGGIVDKFYIITNQEADKATREEVFDYLESEGYSFYLNSKSKIDSPITAEEAREQKLIFLKPAEITSHCSRPEETYIYINFKDDRISYINYRLDSLDEETVEKFKNTFQEVIDSGAFDGYENKTIHYNTGNKDIWSGIMFLFDDDVGSVGNINVSTSNRGICEITYSLN